MHPRTLLRRRPAPATVIASLALFVSLGGASYAAVTIPNSSIGSAKLKNNAVTNAKLAKGAVGTTKIAGNAVTYAKIKQGTIGKARINANQVQERIAGVCTNGAVTSVSATGTVTCKSAAGADYQVNTPSAGTIGPNTANVLTQSLPAGSSYLLTANPQITFAGLPSGTESVNVVCTLSVGGIASSTQARAIQIPLGTRNQTQTIPLSVQVSSAPAVQTAGLACVSSHDGSTQPTITVSATMNALQTASNTTEPYAG